MTRGLIFSILFLVISCAPGQDKNFKSDSLAMTDTITIQNPEAEDENFNEESHEAVDADTTVLDSIKSLFTKPQLNRKVAYVYRRAGLHVYKSLADAGDSTKAAMVIGYGSKIMLTDVLINNQASDKITFEGFKGRYIAVKTEDGSERFIFSGYLTNFPLPTLRTPDEPRYITHTFGLEKYFLRNFHLVTTPVKITSMVMFAESNMPEWWNVHYAFESGIMIADNGYYEGAATSVTLPEGCTMQEGFLLLKALPYMTNFDSAFNKYPPIGFSKKIKEYQNASVESNDEEGITKIVLTDEEGCFGETYVQKVEGRIIIGSGGGC